MSSKVKLLFTFLALSALTTANPTITLTPTPEAILYKRDTTLPTDHISVYATPIPNDEFYIGVGQASVSTGSFNCTSLSLSPLANPAAVQLTNPPTSLDSLQRESIHRQ